jgi:hypothetical protein
MECTMAEHILDEKVRERDIQVDGVKPLATVELKGPMGQVICNDNPQDIAFWKNKGCKVVRNIPPNAGGTDLTTDGGSEPGDGEGDAGTGEE